MRRAIDRQPQVDQDRPFLRQHTDPLDAKFSRRLRGLLCLGSGVCLTLGFRVTFGGLGFGIRSFPFGGIVVVDGVLRILVLA